MRCLVCLVGLIVLGFAGTAQAWQPPPTSPERRLAYFLPVARAAWPDSPCAGHETVTLHAEIPAGDYSFYGYGTYDPAAVALIDSCTAEISDRAPEDPIAWCSLLVHEFGHLALGPAHSDDPSSIMYGEYLTDWPPCAAAVKPPPRIQADIYIRQLLPDDGHGWRITCTPLRGHPRCRATRPPSRPQRFVVHMAGGQVLWVT